MIRTSVSYKQIWQIAYPIILGSVAQNIINVTDTAFLGRVGEIALGAGAIGGIFYISGVMLVWGVGIGTQIIVARRDGEKAYREIGRTIEHSFLFLFPLSILLFIIMSLFSRDVLGSIIHSDEIYAATAEFISYRAFGIFFASINVLFRAFYVGIGRTKVITWSTLVMAAVNVVLDYGLIFGKIGLPEMGIGGAALASVIAEFTASIFFLVYTFSLVPRKKYDLFYFRKPSLEIYRRLIRISLPVMFQNFMSLASWLTFFLFVEKLGEQPLAVSNIIRSFYVVLMIPMWGFSAATSTLVSNLIGQGRGDEVWSLTLKVLRICFSMVLVIVIFGYIFPRPALTIYTNDKSLIEASMPVLYVINVAGLLLSVAFIFFSAVSGTGKTQISFFIELGVIILYLIAAFILADRLKCRISIVWTVEYLYAILLGSLSVIYIRSGKWKSSKV
jgi:putative MATE family efflux protein